MTKIMLALGLAMIISGMILITALPGLLETQVSSGSAVFIWPFPLIIGFTSNQGSLPALIVTLGFLILFVLIAYKWLRAFM